MNQINSQNLPFPAPDVMSENCTSRQVLRHMTSRWGALVLIALDTGTLRFSGLRRRIAGVSERMLAQTLQQLEADGLVLREAHDIVPPHVDYSLTPLGRGASERMCDLARWIEARVGQFSANDPSQLPPPPEA
jgi:DNA-binding HxlR family transcriptional regulator